MNRDVSMARPYVSASIWSAEKSTSRAWRTSVATNGAVTLGTPMLGRPMLRSIGLAAATKYTGGIVLLALLAAFGAHATRNRGAALRGLLLAGVMALAAFLVAFPYALVDHHAFVDGLSHQSDASREAAGKLGFTQDNGWIYYLW